MEQFALDCASRFDFSRLFGDLLDCPQHENQTEERFSRCTICHNRLDCHFLSIFILRWKLRKLLQDLRQYRGDYRPYALALFLRYHSYAGRAVECGHDRAEAGKDRQKNRAMPSTKGALLFSLSISVNPIQHPKSIQDD